VTAVAGKWQLYGASHYTDPFRAQGTLPHDAGFQNVCLWQVDRLSKRYHGPLMYVDGENRQFGPTEYGPEVATQYLDRFIRKNRDRPFLAYYPMILVHSPFVPTPDSTAPESKNKQQNFEDMVAYMDKLVGNIIRTTEELGIAERTLILFAGDNGTHKTLHSTLHGRTIQGGKAQTTDAGTHVPLLAHWPGVIAPGSVCNDLVDFSDFLPTILQTIGHGENANFDGRSFLPQLRGKCGTPREWIYCYYCPRPQRTKPVRFVRDHRWKLYGDGRFFDIENDVFETHPVEKVAPGSSAAAAKQKLSQALASMPEDGQTLLKFSE
jgi:arylsulfatase A-like enzyme